MAWWEIKLEAREACRQNPQPAALVMPQYVTRLKGLPGNPVFVGYPAEYPKLCATSLLPDNPLRPVHHSPEIGER